MNGVIWKRLQHPNVVSFLGFGSSFLESSSDPPPLVLVYPWMSDVNLSEYVHEHPNADRHSLVCGYSQHSH